MKHSSNKIKVLYLIKYMHQNLKTVTVTLTSYTHKNKEPCSSHSDYYFLICKQFKLKVKKKCEYLKGSLKIISSII
jgi:hypothetical protein